MQLFHEEYTIQKNNLIISNPDTISQCRKVLRLQKDSLINIQNTNGKTTTRHLVKILELNKTLITEIIETTEKIKSDSYSQIYVAMPNKQDKLELISQKLTELGVDEIVFWPAERSIIKQRNKNKEQRLKIIVKEALEQSRGRFMPEISFQEKPEECIKEGSDIYIFDKNNESIEIDKISNKKAGIVGPEGGLTQKDYDRFQNNNPKVYNLGSTILRMETAAIIGGWIIKNSK